MKRILIIRKHNHLGDMLCSLPLYAAVKARWPESSITLLAAPTSYPVPLLDINPYLDEVILYRKDSIVSVARLQLALRRSRFDMVIVPSTIRLSQTSHITARLTSAALRVGVASIDGVENPGSRWLTNAVDVRWEAERVHQVERNLDVAVAAGCARPDNPLRLLSIPIAEQAAVKARALLSRFPAGSTWIGVHPGAGKQENIWPAERFAAVLAALHLKRPVGVLITAGSPDAASVARLVELLEADGIPHHVLLDAPIPVLAATIAELSLFLTNDTGTMHVAAFSGARVVSLFGPTPAWEWAPLQPGCTAIQSSDGCMSGIGADEVLEACEHALMLPPPTM